MVDAIHIKKKKTLKKTTIHPLKCAPSSSNKTEHECYFIISSISYYRTPPPKKGQPCLLDFYWLTRFYVVNNVCMQKRNRKRVFLKLQP